MKYQALKTAAGRLSFQAGQENLTFSDADAKALLADGAIRPMSEKDATKAANQQPDEPNEEPAGKKPSGKKAKSPAK